jgi:hypothetical protein
MRFTTNSVEILQSLNNLILGIFHSPEQLAICKSMFPLLLEIRVKRDQNLPIQRVHLSVLLSKAKFFKVRWNQAVMNLMRLANFKICTDWLTNYQWSRTNDATMLNLHLVFPNIALKKDRV